MSWTADQFLGEDFVRKRGRPPSQTGKMTQRKLTALIRAGYGQGHFHRYKSWLRVTKRDYSPGSFVGHLPAPESARLQHPRAIAERGTMQLAKWLGAADVRDAYPAWPWPHEHAGVGLPGFDSAPRQSGLLAIAAKHGLDHGCYPGTDIPYVATIDVLTTWHTESGGYRLIALENKPFDVVHDPNPLLRPKERLELVRRYCVEARVPHVIVHAEKLPLEFSANVDMLQPLLAPKPLADMLSSRIYSEVVGSLQDKGTEKSPNEILDDLRDRHGHGDAVLTSAFYLALWRQDVDHDLRKPFRPWEPLIPGGLAFKKALMKVWGVVA